MVELEPNQDPLQIYLDRFVSDERDVVLHRDPDTDQWTTPDGTIVEPIESLVETEEELNHLRQELKDVTRNGIQTGGRWFVLRETDPIS